MNCSVELDEWNEIGWDGMGLDGMENIELGWIGLQ